MEQIKSYLREISAKQTKLAQEYCECRKAAGIAKVNVELMLTAELKFIRADKPNVGMEMATIMLIERNPTAASFYETWQDNEAKYKGIEKLLEAHASRIMLEMAIMKRQAEGEKWGA